MRTPTPGAKHLYNGLARSQAHHPEIFANGGNKSPRRKASPAARGRTPLKPFRHVSKRFDSRAPSRDGHKLANMSIPGLGQEEPEEETSRDLSGLVKTVDLIKEQEWRFEVVLGKTVEVKVSLRQLLCTIFLREEFIR